MRLVFFIWILCGALSIRAQLTYPHLVVQYDSAWTYKDLKIIPIRPTGPMPNPFPKVISIGQAISQGLATVSERGTASTENVHFLRINNHSDKTILVSSGELIGGGRQDRMLAKDTLLEPNGKDQYIPVMCVEELRWSEKEKKFSYGNFANPNLRKVLDMNHNQLNIWKEVAGQLSHGEIKNKTQSYLSRYADKKMVSVTEEYFRFFQQKFKNTDSTILGFVAVSGKKVLGVDLYASSELFYGQLDPLLMGYCDGAILTGSPPVMSDKDLEDYMDALLKDEKSQEEFVRMNGKIFRQNHQIVHINTF